jgi:flagellar operon protein
MIDAIHRLPPVPGAGGIESVQKPASPTASTTSRADKASSFQSELENQLDRSGAVSFSAHARSRLISRSIQLSSQQVARLEHGVEQAAKKGSRESVVMLDNLAFVVSVPNRTVVTAVDGAAREGNVFTQIDSAVIV